MRICGGGDLDMSELPPWADLVQITSSRGKAVAVTKSGGYSIARCSYVCVSHKLLTSLDSSRFESIDIDFVVVAKLRVKSVLVSPL